MPQSAEAQQPSPVLFFDTINAYQRTAALKAALELDLFTIIGEGIETAEKLAERRQSSERGMRILCDYLVVLGFLKKTAGKYALTSITSTYLDRRAPTYVGSATKFLRSRM